MNRFETLLVLSLTAGLAAQPALLPSQIDVIHES